MLRQSSQCFRDTYGAIKQRCRRILFSPCSGIVTSARDVMFTWRLSVFVCLSLCLLGTSRKNYWSDLHENFTKDVSLDKEDTNNFRSHPHLDHEDPKTEHSNSRIASPHCLLFAIAPFTAPCRRDYVTFCGKQTWGEFTLCGILWCRRGGGRWRGRLVLERACRLSLLLITRHSRIEPEFHSRKWPVV